MTEKGHAKNTANLNLLLEYAVELHESYLPSNPKLAIEQLQILHDLAFQKQQTVNTLIAPYSFAVAEREAIFMPLSKLITKLFHLYKATEGVGEKQIENFMSLSRKLKGERKGKTTAATDASTANQHSVSQMSYDQRSNTFSQLIALLTHTPHYFPAEIPYKIQTLQELHAKMLSSTQNVAEAYIALNSARSKRNHVLYNENDGLIDTALKTKQYLCAILDAESVQYKAISKIKFYRLY